MRASVFWVVLLRGATLARPQAALAQTYRLTSWQGHPATISLSYKLFSKRLAVACAGDSLFLKDYQGTHSVRVLQHRFLQITYQTRCGAGCQTQNTVLLSIDQHRLRVSLSVMSRNEWDDFSPRHTRAGRYHVSFAMPAGAADQYRLRAQVLAEYRDQREPAQSQVLHRSLTLAFDPSQKVFYSAFEPDARWWPLVQPKAATSWPIPWVPSSFTSSIPRMPPYAVGAFPVIRLVGQQYYFIRGEWYAGAEKPEVGTPDRFTHEDIQRVPARGQAPAQW